jgi:HEAT repeat protein
MALEVLGFIGSEDALNRIARFLMDPRPGMRIEALRQLNGRVPETARPTVLALQRDPVDLVKWVARGVEMGS